MAGGDIGRAPSGNRLSSTTEPASGLRPAGFDPARGFRVLVCGGRRFTDGDALFEILDRIDRRRRIALIIEGGQRTRDPTTGELIGGADYWACRWSYARARPGMRFDADWRGLGRAAGPIRNQRMIDEGKPDLVVAFPGGDGTADMKRKARAAGIPIEHAVPVTRDRDGAEGGDANAAPVPQDRHARAEGIAQNPLEGL